MTSESDIAGLFMLGLLGTGHCIGMCGPLAAAFPGRSHRVVSHWMYHTGRITMYSAVGAALGGMGGLAASVTLAAGGNPLTTVAGFQVVFSVIASLALGWLGLARIGLVPEPSWMSAASPQKIPGFRQTVTVGIVPSPLRMLATGFFFGLLPCGLSFAAFARALAAGGFFKGAVLLAAFGLGTLPGLFAAGAGAAGLFRKYRVYADPVSGMLMLGMAVNLAVEAFRTL